MSFKVTFLAATSKLRPTQIGLFCHRGTLSLAPEARGRSGRSSQRYRVNTVLLFCAQGEACPVVVS